MSNLSKLKPYVGQYKKALILSPLAMVGEAAMETVIPFLISMIVDVGVANKDMAYIVKIGLLMVVLALFSLLCGTASARFAAKGAVGFAANLRKAIYHKIQHFSFYNIDKYSTSSLVTRMTTDVNNTQNALMMIVRMGVRGPMMLVFAGVMAMVVNAELAKIFLVAVPFLAVALFIIIRIAFPRFQVLMTKYDGLNKSVQENLIAIRVVKAFVRSKHEKEKFDQSADDLMNAQKSAERVVILNMPIMQLTVYACIVAVLFIGGKLIIGNKMGTGELFSFISYVTQILMSLMMLSMIFINIVLSRASIKRICELLDETPDIVQPEQPLTSVQNGEITFQNVGFSYKKDKQNEVLQNINFTIHSGETIGLIGGTGSAKSSLVQLIPRLYDVTEGAVTVGGEDVRKYDKNVLRDNVSMVLQKNVLFSGTIEDNLRWGDKTATQAEIEWACKAAKAYDFIMSFPDGFKTDLGQGGVNVSGGQKQRLCIARALLKKPKIMILDDATSAVDTATDASIREALRTELGNTTKIIIAQRITSVMDADRIIVLNDGKISDIGTHEELLRRSEIYREVYTSQQKGAAA